MTSRDASTSTDRVFYDFIETEPSTRKRQNLEVVWQALNELRAEGAADYSIARVGRRVQELGGPRTQSLRNERGAHFRKMIEAFAAAVGCPHRKAPLRARTQVEAAISHISDLGVRTVLRMIIEENRRLKKENDTLRNTYKELSVGVTAVDQQRIGGDKTGSALEPVRPHLQIDSAMIDAFMRFLSDRWMDERGLCVEPDGSVVDTGAGGNLLAPPAFADGLRIVIENYQG